MVSRAESPSIVGKATLAALSCLAVSWAGCGGGAGAPWRADLGDRDLDRGHPATVYLDSECSGVLVAPHLVLTAAHCVLTEQPPTSVVVAEGRRRARLGVRRCQLHPDAAGEGGCDAGPGSPPAPGADLALLELDGAVPTDLASPLPVLIGAPRRWPDPTRVRLVGWNRRPFTVGVPRRYGGLNRVVRVGPRTLTTRPARRGGFSTRRGNSGGPVLVRVAGELAVAGVLHGGSARDAEESVFATTFSPRSSSWIAWRLLPFLLTDLPPYEPDASGGAARSGVFVTTPWPPSFR